MGRSSRCRWIKQTMTLCFKRLRTIVMRRLITYEVHCALLWRNWLRAPRWIRAPLTKWRKSLIKRRTPTMKSQIRRLHINYRLNKPSSQRFRAPQDRCQGIFWSQERPWPPITSSAASTTRTWTTSLTKNSFGIILVTQTRIRSCKEG